MTFGELIRKKRIELNLTQQYVADELDLYLATIWSYERGGREPKLDRAVQMCKLLGITPEEFFGLYPYNKTKGEWS